MKLNEKQQKDKTILILSTPYNNKKMTTKVLSLQSYLDVTLALVGTCSEKMESGITNGCHPFYFDSKQLFSIWDQEQ